MSEAKTRRAAGMPLLRQVKVDSPIHRLSTETKFVAVAGMSITGSYFPSWGSIGILAGLLIVATLLARIPAGALPRVPRWFWIVLLISGGFASFAGGSPYLNLGPHQIGLGAADAYARFVLDGVVLLFGGILIGWTTSLSDVAPAMKRLFSPFRLIRLPVEEWAVTVALCVRSFPLVLDEIRTLVAARRLRPRPPLGPDQTSLERIGQEAVDLTVAILAMSVRRSGELADAITARGGIGLIAVGKRKMQISDVVTLLIVGLACLAASQMPGA